MEAIVTAAIKATIQVEDDPRTRCSIKIYESDEEQNECT
jgi:hypothetical protein